MIILNLLLHRVVSSEPSKQWLSPSQIKSFEMQWCLYVQRKSKHDCTAVNINFFHSSTYIIVIILKKKGKLL